MSDEKRNQWRELHEASSALLDVLAPHNLWLATRDQTARALANCDPDALEELVEAVERLTEAAQSYMDYHAEKFYAGLPKPVGMWPEIARTSTALRKFRGER